jgi:uncharacterized repeat protein (TIGR03803 family)
MSTFSESVLLEPRVLHIFVDNFDTLLSNQSSVNTFLNYTQTNCINFLSFYDIQRVLPTSATTLSNFIFQAKTNYGVCECAGSIDLFDVSTNGLNRPNTILNYNLLVGNVNKQMTWLTIENEWWNLETNPTQTTFNSCSTTSGSDLVTLNGPSIVAPISLENIIRINGEYRQIKQIVSATSIRVDRPFGNTNTNTSFVIYDVINNAYQLDFDTFLYRLKLLRTFANTNNFKLEAYLPRKGTAQQYYKMAPFLDRILLEEEQNSQEYATYNRFVAPTGVSRRVRQILIDSTAFRSGTITVTNNVINGTGTLFTEDLAVGRPITVAGQKLTIQAINSNTQAIATTNASPNIGAPSQFRTFVNIAPIFYINLTNVRTWMQSPPDSKTFIDVYKLHALSGYSVGANTQIGVSPIAYQNEIHPGITGSTFLDGLSIFSRSFAQTAIDIKHPTTPCTSCGATSGGTSGFTLNTLVYGNTNCDNAHNGYITVSFNPINLVAPFTYNFIGPTNSIQITTNASQQTFSGCESGSWSVFVQDSSGMQSNTVTGIMIYETFNPTAVSNGSGTVSIMLSGGVAPYYVIEPTTSFFNSPSSSGTYTFTGFTPGSTYTFTVGDNNGCWEYLPVTITSGGTNLSITVTATNPTCDNALNGTITTTINSSSTGPYTYTYSNGTNTYVLNSSLLTNIFTGADSGTWTVRVTDSSTPTQLTSNTVTIGLSQTFNATVSSTGFGTVCFYLTGGTLPYYIHDANNTFFKSVSGHGISCFSILCGAYAFTIGDANSCNTLISPVNILCGGINLSLVSSTNSECFGTCSGSVRVAANNGTFPYTYSATNGTIYYVNTTGVFSGLCSENWTFTAKDSTGVHSTSLTVNVSNNFFTTAYTQNGQICVYASGSPTGQYVVIINGQQYNYSAGTMCYTPQGCGNIDVLITDSSTSNSNYLPFKSLSTFGSLSGDGSLCKSELVEMSNGLLYGLTRFGGVFNLGIIFSFNPLTNNRTILHHFSGGTDGAQPNNSFYEATNHLLYATTEFGGNSNQGTLFSFNITSNTLTILHHFSGGTADGNEPMAGLVQAANGKLYGTTNGGGAGTNGAVGTIFSYNPNTNVYAKVYDFNGGLDARYPEGTLLAASDGNLYGMTPFGTTGFAGVGTIFKFNPNTNVETILYHFAGTTDGAFPRAGALIEGTNGLLYGLTLNGGTSNNGTLFNFNKSSLVMTILMNFTTNVTGILPRGGLLQASDGNLYFTTTQGGYFNTTGTLIKYNITTSASTVLHEFTGGWDGGGSSVTLMQASDGKIYGANNSGGYNGNHGVIFSYDINTTNNIVYNKLINFSGTPDAGFSESDLLQATNGKLYGTSVLGGIANKGTLFDYNINTNIKTILYSFSGGTTDGENPYGTVIQATNGLLYGLTKFGGVLNSGTIYSYNTNTNVKTHLYSFSGSPDGLYPEGSLVQASNGKLYGTTVRGGVLGYGTVFSFDTVTNIKTTLGHFSGGTDGMYPLESLIQASDGQLYGTTASGGTNNYGTIFLYNIPFNYLFVPYNFTGFADGATPKGSLLQASNGSLYGTTHSGGVPYSGGCGIIFKYETNGGFYTIVYKFDGDRDGAFPHGTLLQASDGLLYGLLEQGGRYRRGTVFVFDPLNVAGESIYHFSGTSHDGIYPAASLIEASNGKLYGLTARGGNLSSPNDGGILFSLSLTSSGTCVYNPTLFIDCSFNIQLSGTPVHCPSDSNGSITAWPIGGISPYSFTATNGTFTYISNSNPAHFTGLQDAVWTVYGIDSSGNTTSNIIDLSPTLYWNFHTISQSGTSGLICVTVSGGTPPYTINLLGIEYSGLSAGTYCYSRLCGRYYELSVNDYYNCNLFIQAFFPLPCQLPLGLISNVDQPDCGQTGGTITLQGSGGTETYVSYSAFSATTIYTSINSPAIFSGITIGTWNVVVEDTDGNISAGVLIINPSSFQTTVTGMWQSGPKVCVSIDPSQLTSSYQVIVDGQAQSFNTAFSANCFSVSGCGLTNVTVRRLISNYTILYSFIDIIEGGGPFGDVIQLNNGLLYGTTSAFGTFGMGGIFNYNIITNTENLLYEFSGADGESPKSSFLNINNNLLLGTTQLGGTFSEGTLFSFDISANTLTTLHHWNPSTFDGAEPFTSPILHSNGKLYGMTPFGGLLGLGIIYEFNLSSNTRIVRYHFSGLTIGGPNDAAVPYGKLLSVTDNLLFGVSSQGGLQDKGALFSYNISANTTTVLHNFTGGTSSGDSPFGSLVLGPNDILFGTTFVGGSGANGTIFGFSISSNTITHFSNFPGSPNGRNPRNIFYNPLDQSIYGATQFGDPSTTNGVIYVFNPILNTLTTVHTFLGATTDGSGFLGSLYRGNDGLLYGLTNTGGDYNAGTIFRFDSGCDFNTNVNIPCDQTLTIVRESKINPGCLTPLTGVIGIAALGGVSPYHWVLTNGINTYSGNTTGTNAIIFSGLYASTWVATVTDISGNTATDITVLSNMFIDTYNLNNNSMFCLSGSSGNPPYQIFLDGILKQTFSSSTFDSCFSATCGTGHTLQVIDHSGCTYTELVTLPCIPLDLNVIVEPAFCNGNHAIIHLFASGGTGNYTYFVDTGNFVYQSSNPSFFMVTGNYIVSVIDSAGNQVIYPTIVTVPYVYSATITPINNGVSVTFSGGDYTQIIIDGTLLGNYLDGTYTFPLTCGINHTVEVNGYNSTWVIGGECLNSQTIFIPCGPFGWVNLSWINPSCYNLNDGSITAIISGGTSPYTYEAISPNIGYTVVSTGTTYTFPQLEVGTWIVTVTDANGNSVTQTVILSSGFVVGVATGINSYTVNMSGGTAPYSLYLDGILIDSQLNNGIYTYSASCGPHTVHVIQPFGVNDCPWDFNIDIPCEPPTLIVTFTNPTCNNNSNGTITATGSHGLAPYTFTITDGNTTYTNNTGIFNNLGSGIWTVTLTDSSANPTPVITSVTLIGNFNMLTSTGSTFGQLCVTILGGLPPFNVYIDNILRTSATTQTVLCYSAICGSNHSIIVTDSTPPCTIFVNEEIFQNTSFATAANWIVGYGGNISGHTLGNGAFSFTGLTATPVGGPITDIYLTQSYPFPNHPLSISYAWQFSTGGGDFWPFSHYSFVEFLDPYGGGFVLNNPFGTTANSTYSGTINYNPTSFILPTTGATIGMVFSPGNNMILPHLTLLDVAVQLVSYTVACPCSITGHTYVPCEPPLGLTLISYTNPACDNADNGIISVSGYNGTPLYTYSATNGTISYTSTTGTFTNLSAGTWYLAVIDSVGSTATLTSLITLQDTFYAVISSYNNGYCVTISGGTIPYIIDDNGTPLTWNYGNLTNCYPPISGCGITSIITVRDSS